MADILSPDWKYSCHPLLFGADTPVKNWADFNTLEEVFKTSFRKVLKDTKFDLLDCLQHLCRDWVDLKFSRWKSGRKCVVFFTRTENC
jgi:hypothetical protein